MFAMTKHDLFIDESIKKIRRQDNIVCIRGMGVELVLMDKQMKIQPSEDLKEQISDGYALIKQIVKTDWVINNEETAQKMVGIQEKWVKVIVSALQGTGKYVKSVNVFVAKHSFNIYLQFVQIKKRSVSKVWKTSPAKKIKRERQTEINNRTNVKQITFVAANTNQQQVGSAQSSTMELYEETNPTDNAHQTSTMESNDAVLSQQEIREEHKFVWEANVNPSFDTQRLSLYENLLDVPRIQPVQAAYIAIHYGNMQNLMNAYKQIKDARERELMLHNSVTVCYSWKYSVDAIMNGLQEVPELEEQQSLMDLRKAQNFQYFSMALPEFVSHRIYNYMNDDSGEYETGRNVDNTQEELKKEVEELQRYCEEHAILTDAERMKIIQNEFGDCRQLRYAQDIHGIVYGLWTESADEWLEKKKFELRVIDIKATVESVSPLRYTVSLDGMEWRKKNEETLRIENKRNDELYVRWLPAIEAPGQVKNAQFSVAQLAIDPMYLVILENSVLKSQSESGYCQMTPYIMTNTDSRTFDDSELNYEWFAKNIKLDFGMIQQQLLSDMYN